LVFCPIQAKPGVEARSSKYRLRMRASAIVQITEPRAAIPPSMVTIVPEM